MVEPITGYGDFTGIEYKDVDWKLVAGLVVDCLTDQGYPVTLLPDAGLEVGSLPAGEMPIFQSTKSACEAGLNLPDYVPLDQTEIDDLYAWLVEVADCLEREFAIIQESLPSIEAYRDQFFTNPWHPYGAIPDAQMGAIETIEEACPQTRPAPP